ncbi:MAG: metallophosphoesterase, partial [Deltaproteobacteria bacterium]|nr:metallophosphoesterase [Deltaproteobacteria bacterium]
MSVGARVLGLAVACGALVGGPAHAGDGVRWLKGPYIQNAAPEAITILWETAEAVPGDVVVTGPDGDHKATADDARRHEVVINGLQPATRYRYSVTSGGATRNGELTTPPAPGTDAPITFIVYGDTRSSTDSHRRVMERIRSEVPDFLLGTGDMVDEGGREEQWQQFFDAEGPLLRDNVLYPALGNHDRQGRGRTADTYRAFFAVPENAPDAERYYSFTYAQSKFLILDSNSNSFALTDQTAWLERELAAARDDRRIHHVFVVMHHPPYSISLHGGQRDLRERWTPLFEKYQVTAVFSGHDHVYERAEADGVRYFVSGGGGAPLYPRKAKSAGLDLAAVKYFERVNHYLRVHVAGDQIEVTAVRVDGTPIETITWAEPRETPDLTPRPVPAIGGPPPPPSMAPAPAPAAPVAPEESSLGWTAIDANAT